MGSLSSGGRGERWLERCGVDVGGVGCGGMWGGEEGGRVAIVENPVLLWSII